MTTKLCNICNRISYPDECGCDCTTPQKIKNREAYEKFKEEQQQEWEKMRKLGKANYFAKINDKQIRFNPTEHEEEEEEEWQT